MIKVKIESSDVSLDEAKAWTDKVENAYTDMQIENVSVSDNEISFSVGLAGEENTNPEEIRKRLDKYLTNEPSSIEAVGPIITEPILPNGDSTDG